MISTKIENWQRKIDEHYFAVKDIVENLCGSLAMERFAHSHIDGNTHGCWLILRDARLIAHTSKEVFKNFSDLKMLHELCSEYMQLLKERFTS